ncbi:complement component C7 [Cololabis saira]|uniref:complement component C7 n=1 Tax=Cololabis saira TaxID=129043 RepID=UPI002AD4F9E2|nr:complement component C7 [Cololabis saira]
MKNIAQLCAAVLPWVVFLSTNNVFCVQRIHCQWGSYGSWSDCDPCTKLQTRSRAMSIYSQFEGNPCDGVRTETRPCETTQGCPLDEGCGGRFRCRSGKCISKSLMCNGDQDCEEDGLDERGCTIQKFIICVHTVPPPNIELLGLGFDAVTGERRGSVINTKSFGGQCRSIYSGDHNMIYRLPLSVTQYNFLVKVQNDFSDEMYSSKWHYAKHIVNRETVSGTTTGYKNYDFHESHDQTRTQKLLVLKNDIEVSQFQSNSPNYLPISEEFWRALAKLPSVYDYSAYRKIVERFGTHYVSEGSLGGSFKVVAAIDEETERRTVSEKTQQHECVRTKRWILIFPIYHEECWNNNHQMSLTTERRRSNEVEKVNVEGGGISHIAALKRLDLNEPSKNWEMYSNWAESVRSFPQIIKQKLRPLSELVKEVQCAGVKKLYLRKAIEQYLAESHPCHCQPCRNNGIVVMAGDKCKCICKPGTSGRACEQGAEVEGQPGVISGGWSCWSAWSSCSVGRRSRSRSCSNPSPQNGGRNCIGEATETSDCEDQELEYFKTMEPQCFDNTLLPTEECETPPPLINGYIVNPKDIYLVGSKVEYTCTVGFYLIGSGTLDCTADKTWSADPGLCVVSACRLQSLNKDVIASPLSQAYMIGDVVTLSCPEDRTLQGEATITCDPSLHFSPDPADIRCSPKTQQQQIRPEVQCEVWEKPSKGKCVCKIPHECSSSLEVCAASPAGRRFIPITVCKMHALQCMGKKHEVAEHGNCAWPQRNTTGCTNCHMWEYCDDQTNDCRCKGPADCLTPGLNVCVRVGEDVTAATQTMSECEAGVRRCSGEKLSVVSIVPCAED